MAYNRRKFLALAAKSAFAIGAGGKVMSYPLRALASRSPAAVDLRFAIASDGHYGEPKTTYESNYQEMVSWLNLEKTEGQVDFTMINGDLIHNDPAYLAPVKAALDKLSMPYYVSRGNHDMIPEEEWEKTWQRPSNYAFEKSNVGFLVLSTTDEKGNYVCPDLEWTHKHLTLYADKKHLFVFMHITPVKWTDNANPCPEIVEMFNRQKNLKAVFNGHDHDQDHIKDNDGKAYFFDSHLGGSWGTEYHGYRIVEILKNGEVLTYQMNPSAKQKVNANEIRA